MTAGMSGTIWNAKVAEAHQPHFLGETYMAIVISMGLTFLLTTLLLAFLAFWFVLRPLAEHMKENREGATALSEHVLVPLFGKKGVGAELVPGSEKLEGAATLEASEVGQCRQSRKR
jgi:hypothetical protein